METLRSLRIGTRLSIAFATLLTLLCFVAWFGSVQLSKINDNVKDLNTNWLPSVALLGQMQSAADSARRASMSAAVELDDAGRKAAVGQREAALRDFQRAAREYEPTITGDEERALYVAIQQAWQQYVTADGEIQSVIAKGESAHEEARKLVTGRANALFQVLSVAIDKDVTFNRNGGDVAGQDAANSYTRGMRTSIVAVVVALALGAALARLVTRSITGPIAQAVRVSEEVSMGNLTLDLQARERDEPADLLRAMARMVEQLGSLVGQVRDSSGSIATGSQQIAQGNADLSQRTETQASSLQQTAASMAELTSSVAQNAGAADEASRMAARASGAAGEGGKAVTELVQTMQGISESSRRIEDIIGVIDAIAFQTNILSLNAAVEAARAGEQGRGFAVVASEVRALAQRSAGAAKEIKTLIQTSGQRVEVGARQAQDAGDTIRRVVEEVGQVNALIREISNATQEQNGGIQQVGSAVTHLDSVTQQNAALVEESAAAAESLNSQAQHLAQLVSQFRLRTA
ncbi:methyl-accepting chemotaxis protein [Roseateles aquatilis]|nr:methyl-accepting chemotaxis protein [Roseateles aquatilis]